MAEPVTKREVAVVEARVEEAVERKPLRKARVVLVAFSLVLSLVQGHWKVVARVPVVRESPWPRVRAPREPPGKMYGMVEERLVMAREVVVAEVVVAFEAVKF